MIVAAGGAILAAIGHEAVGKGRPFALREQVHEVMLDFVGISVAGKAQAARQAAHMRIHRNADDNAESILEYDI